MHVYVITNLVNGKIYVGQHVGEDLQAYFKSCVRSALRGADNKPHLYNAIRKHGTQAFAVTSLVNPIDKDQMDRLEAFFIRTLEAQDTEFGYNIMSGGSGGMLGLRHSAATLDKMSVTRKGQTKSREWAQHLSDSQRNRVFTDTHKRNLSVGQTGKSKRRSPEHCRKLSEAKKRWWACKGMAVANGTITN